MKTLTDAISYLERRATSPAKKALLIIAKEVEALKGASAEGGTGKSAKAAKGGEPAKTADVPAEKANDAG